MSRVMAEFTAAVGHRSGEEFGFRKCREKRRRGDFKASTKKFWDDHLLSASANLVHLLTIRPHNNDPSRTNSHRAERTDSKDDVYGEFDCTPRGKSAFDFLPQRLPECKWLRLCVG